MHRGAAGPVIEVAVQVDETRGNQLARYVNALAALVRRDAVGDGGDLAILERNIAPFVVDTLRRI